VLSENSWQLLSTPEHDTLKPAIPPGTLLSVPQAAEYRHISDRRFGLGEWRELTLFGHYWRVDFCAQQRGD
jgi:hypothetical protein